MSLITNLGLNIDVVSVVSVLHIKIPSFGFVDTIECTGVMFCTKDISIAAFVKDEMI